MTKERRSDAGGPVRICQGSVGANKAVLSDQALW